MSKNAVAVKESAEVVEASLPAGYDLDELQRDAAANPQLSAADIAIPFLVILQTNSPQVNPAKTQYIPGATAGMIYNSVSGEVYDGRTQGVVIVPCAYHRAYVEWVHRDNGGGWVAEHSIDSDILSRTTLDEKKKPRLENGNVITETAYNYVLFQNPTTGAWSQALVAMSSTHLKANRKLNQMITASKIPGTDIQAPRFLYAYQLTSTIETKGENAFFVPELKKIESPIEVTLYRHAKKYAEAVNSGKVQVGAATQVPAAEESIDPETGEIL